MQNSHFNRALAAIMIGGLTLTGAIAQESDRHPLAERDPFINQLHNNTLSPVTPSTPFAPKPVNKPAPRPSAEKQGSVETQPLAVEMPDVAVTGIVNANGKRQAILYSQDISRIVDVGSKLADFQVTEIEADGVVLSHGQQKVKIPLSAEF